MAGQNDCHQACGSGTFLMPHYLMEILEVLLAGRVGVDHKGSQVAECIGGMTVHHMGTWIGWSLNTMSHAFKILPSGQPFGGFTWSLA